MKERKSSRCGVDMQPHLLSGYGQRVKDNRDNSDLEAKPVSGSIQAIAKTIRPVSAMGREHWCGLEGCPTCETERKNAAK